MRNLLRIERTWIFNLFNYIWIGVICYLSFIPHNISILAWIAPFSLFLLLKKYKNDYKRLFLHGVISGSFITMISFFWMNHLFIVFGNFPPPIAFLLFILYSIITNLRYGVYLVVFEFLRKKIQLNSLLISSYAIIFSEFFTFQIFPYFFGNLVAGDEIISQNIEYIGIYGLSGIVFLVSFYIYKLVYHFKSILKIKFLKKFLIYSTLPITVIILSYLNGYYLYNKWEKYPVSFSSKVMMIQPNSPLEFRDGRSISRTLEDVMNHIEELAIKGSEGIEPDLIVIPESGVPFLSANNKEATNIFHRSYSERFESLIFLLSNRFKANVFFNELDATFINNQVKRENQRFYNSSSLFDPNGERREGYQKSYLLGFGEYIPLGETFPFLYDLLPQVGHFLKGDNLNLITYFENYKKSESLGKSHLRWMDSSFMNLRSIKEYYSNYKTELIEKGKFLPLICYEVIIPEFVRKFKDSGNPDYIVNITNDKWYGPSVESFQHLELARIRSIEFRRWMVRSTNSGTSVFVDHLGRILNNQFSPQEKSTVITAQIDIIRSEPTFYLKYGDLVPWSYLILVTIYCIFIYYKNYR